MRNVRYIKIRGSSKNYRSHMKENIYKFAHSSIRGSKASVKWATELKDLVKEGKIEEAIKKQNRIRI